MGDTRKLVSTNETSLTTQQVVMQNMRYLIQLDFEEMKLSPFEEKRPMPYADVEVDP